MPAHTHVKGNVDKFGPPPGGVPVFVDDTPVLLGHSDKSIEEKARILTEHGMDNLTADSLMDLGATGIEKVAKIAGLGGTKRPETVGNPIIQAILIAVTQRGGTLPAITLPTIEGEALSNE